MLGALSNSGRGAAIEVEAAGATRGGGVLLVIVWCCLFHPHVHTKTCNRIERLEALWTL